MNLHKILKRKASSDCILITSKYCEFGENVAHSWKNRCVYLHATMNLLTSTHRYLWMNIFLFLLTFLLHFFSEIQWSIFWICSLIQRNCSTKEWVIPSHPERTQNLKHINKAQLWRQLNKLDKHVTPFLHLQEQLKPSGKPVREICEREDPRIFLRHFPYFEIMDIQASNKCNFI